MEIRTRIALGGGRVHITWRHDFCDALVQRPLEDGFGCAAADIRRREAKLDWVVTKCLAHLVRHLRNAMLAIVLMHAKL